MRMARTDTVFLDSAFMKPFQGYLRVILLLA